MPFTIQIGILCGWVGWVWMSWVWVGWRGWIWALYTSSDHDDRLNPSAIFMCFVYVVRSRLWYLWSTRWVLIFFSPIDYDDFWSLAYALIWLAVYWTPHGTEIWFVPSYIIIWTITKLIIEYRQMFIVTVTTTSTCNYHMMV